MKQIESLALVKRKNPNIHKKSDYLICKSCGTNKFINMTGRQELCSSCNYYHKKLLSKVYQLETWIENYRRELFYIKYHDQFFGRNKRKKK